MPIIDSHCHLTDPRLLGQVDDVMARARSAGVTGVVAIGCGPADARRAIELAGRFDDVWAAAAIHPHDAKNYSPEALAEIEQLLVVGRASNEGPGAAGSLSASAITGRQAASGTHQMIRDRTPGRPRVVAIGEIGLDYHYDFSPRDAQQAAFEGQLRLAGRVGLPVIIHSRESIADALAIIERVRAEGVAVRGVFHSFTGVADEAQAILAAGFHISISGVVTFKKSEALQAAARLIPVDRLLIETDAPYLSPDPVRKIKVNEPALIVHTLLRLAELRGQDAESLAVATAGNAVELFKLTQA